MSSEQLYMCSFDLGGNRRSIISTEGLCAFKDGFWLNKKYELTKGIDAKIWIPPSKIRYVIKSMDVNTEDDF